MEKGKTQTIYRCLEPEQSEDDLVLENPTVTKRKKKKLMKMKRNQVIRTVVIIVAPVIHPLLLHGILYDKPSGSVQQA